jgi:hypothetical protein
MKKTLIVTVVFLVGPSLLIALGCGKQAPQVISEPVAETPSPLPEPTPIPTPAMVELKKSGSTGLLGVPLPKGAVLISSFPGNRAKFEDPRETYQIDATDEQLRSFFRREMPSLGWVLGPNSSDNFLIYSWNHQMVGVNINKKDDTFWLWGS